MLPPVFQANFSTASHEGSSKFPATGFINAVVTPLLDTVRKLWSCVIREMRILFGMILTVLRGRRINENMVWTDSQDYGADEILYIARTALFNKTNQLIREIIILLMVYPPVVS